MRYHRPAQQAEHMTATVENIPAITEYAVPYAIPETIFRICVSMVSLYSESALIFPITIRKVPTEIKEGESTLTL